MNRTSNIWQQCLFSSLFVVIISAPLALMPFGNDKDISSQEQRKLAPKPTLKLSVKSLSDFPNKYAAYFDDHFGQRNRILTWANKLKEKLFNRSKARNVIFGQNKWMFYNVEGSILDHIGHFQPSEKQLQQWKKTLETKHWWLASLDIKYVLVVLPSKGSVYPEMLPERINRVSGTTRLMAFSRYLTEHGGLPYFLDATPVMLEKKKQRQVFFKTDTHWNDDGAYSVYIATLQLMNDWFDDIHPIDKERITRKPYEKIGDIARIGLEMDGRREQAESLRITSPCATPDYIKIYRFANTDAFKSHPNKLPVANGCKHKKYKVIAVHDSFGQYLKQFLNESFSEVIYMTSYDVYEMQSFIEDFKPDFFIDFRVDRNMHHLLELDERMNTALSQHEYIRLNTNAE